MTFFAQVGEMELLLTVSVAPGSTPFLVARPTLEALGVGVAHDNKNGKLKFDGSDWFSPERGGKGHYILNLLDYPNEGLLQGGTEESFIVSDGEDYGAGDGIKLARDWMILGALSLLWRRRPLIVMRWFFLRLKGRKQSLWPRESSKGFDAMRS